MKPLLAILSYAKANAMVERHWPYFEKAGADILFVGREDTDCRYPTGAGNRSMIGSVKIGKDSYVNGDNLPRLFLDTLEHCLERYPHEDIILTEPDTIFVRPLPPHPGGFAGCLSGGASLGFFSPFYFHPVWRMDRATATLMVEAGERLLQCGLIENGFPDRWLGLLVYLFNIGWTNFPEYSRQALDSGEKIREAREAIIEGAVAIHGVKTFDMLNAVTSGLVTL